MQELISHHWLHLDRIMQAFSRIGDIILRHSFHSNQPLAVMLAICAQNQGFDEAYRRGWTLSEAPDDNHIVVHLCICPKQTINGHEEVPGDGQVPEEDRWLRFYDFADELHNSIKGAIELVSRPGAKTSP